MISSSPSSSSSTALPSTAFSVAALKSTLSCCRRLLRGGGWFWSCWWPLEPAGGAGSAVTERSPDLLTERGRAVNARASSSLEGVPTDFCGLAAPGTTAPSGLPLCTERGWEPAADRVVRSARAEVLLEVEDALLDCWAVVVWEPMGRVRDDRRGERGALGMGMQGISTRI
jgi:hypothetical protein